MVTKVTWILHQKVLGINVGQGDQAPHVAQDIYSVLEQTKALRIHTFFYVHDPVVLRELASASADHWSHNQGWVIFIEPGRDTDHNLTHELISTHLKPMYVASSMLDAWRFLCKTDPHVPHVERFQAARWQHLNTGLAL